MELGENTPKPETRFTFVEPGPKFVDLIGDNKDRNNQLSSTIKTEETDYKPVRRFFTEREGLIDLESYFEQVNTQLKKIEGPEVEEMRETVTAFRENLVFIGETELQNAVQEMSNKIADFAREGKTVYLYPHNLRSEKYITLRVLEELDANLEDSPQLKNRIKVSASEHKIFEDCKDNIGDTKIVVLDDFLISGIQITGAMGRVARVLKEKGVEQPNLIIEGFIVASAIRTGGNLEQVLKSGNVNAYFGISEFRNSKGMWFFHPGISVSGSHASTDYGFETTIDDIQKFLYKNGLDEPRFPFLYNIDRVYDTEGWTSRKYADPELQKRWEKMEQKFGL